MYTQDQINCMPIKDTKNEIDLIYQMELYDLHISGLTSDERESVKQYEIFLKHHIHELELKLFYIIKEACIKIYHRILNF